MKPTINSQTGSTHKENPLKRIKWLWKPKPSSKTINTLKLIRANSQILPSIREHLNPIELQKALQGEMLNEYHGVIRLYFDIGICNEIEAIARSLKDRRNQTVTIPQMMGWGGQLAYSYYLNFFSPDAYFTVKEDRPQGSRFPKPYDFLIGQTFSDDPDKEFFTIEVKTSPHGSQTLNYYKKFNEPYPKYVVAIRCLNEEMTKYELFGYTLGLKVKEHKWTPKYGKKCHHMSLNRTNFDYYSHFHAYILGLPYHNKFKD